MKYILNLSHVQKIYGKKENQVEALKDISIQVKEGEFAAIVGTSGSGKSTLLNLVGGLDTPTKGEIFVKGREIGSLTRKELTIFRRRNIGFVFQQYNLVPVLSIFENIVLPLRLDGTGIDAGLLEAVTESLGIADKLERLPGMLSGGQQQRAAIARALMAKPAIVLADEPTGSLDSSASMEVVGLLKSCAEKFCQTVILVTHQEEVAKLADRILRLEDGRLVRQEG